MNSEGGQVYSIVYCNFLVLLSACLMQSKHKQTLSEHSTDETLTVYSFLCRYHYTKSKNYLKRRYQIPMIIGHTVESL